MSSVARKPKKSTSFIIKDLVSSLHGRRPDASWGLEGPYFRTVLCCCAKAIQTIDFSIVTVYFRQCEVEWVLLLV